jgi:hypothetical protein
MVCFTMAVDVVPEETWILDDQGCRYMTVSVGDVVSGGAAFRFAEITCAATRDAIRLPASPA